MRAVPLFLIVAALFAGCANPGTDTTTTTSVPPPSPHVYSLDTDHPERNMTFLLEIRDLTMGNCTMSYSYAQYQAARILRYYTTLDYEPGEEEYQVGGEYYTTRTHAHVSPAGVDTRQEWDDGDIVNVYTLGAGIPLESAGRYAVAMGGLADSSFHFDVTCPAPATVSLLGLGHELDIVLYERLDGGAGFSAQTGLRDGAASISGSYEETYTSNRLLLLVDSYLATQYGTLDIAGSIQANYLFLVNPRIYDVLEGPGGPLRFDLTSAADSNFFHVIIFGFDDPESASAGKITA